MASQSRNIAAQRKQTRLPLQSNFRQAAKFREAIASLTAVVAR
jgi:hypothetical protein